MHTTGFFPYIYYIEWVDTVTTLPSLRASTGQVWCMHGHGKGVYFAVCTGYIIKAQIVWAQSVPLLIGKCMH